MKAGPHRRNSRDEGECRKPERLELLRARRAVFVRRGQRALLIRLLNFANMDDSRIRQCVPHGW